MEIEYRQNLEEREDSSFSRLYELEEVSRYRLNPFIEYKDSENILIWLRTNVCIRVNKELVEELFKLVKEQ